VPGVQVGGQAGKAQLGQPRLASRLARAGLRLAAPLADSALLGGLAGAAELVVVQPPPQGPIGGAELGGHGGQRPRPGGEAVGEVGGEGGETELGGS